MTRTTWAIGVALLLLLGLLHELLARWLAGSTLVAALLAPQGVQSVLVLLGALGFLAVRLALLVVAPGAVGALAAVALTRWVAARRKTQ
jgi:hypothetical protein